MREVKELIVVGGPNGSGKTTFAEEYVAQHGGSYISADAIMFQLSQAASGNIQIASGREFIRRVKEAIDNDTNIIVESTLSGRTFRLVLDHARLAGFTITILYLFIDSADTCIARVNERVHKGGHFVPAPDIRRRFGRSIINFWHLYRPMADYWALIYNSSDLSQNVASGDTDDTNELIIHNVDLYSLFEKLLEV